MNNAGTVSGWRIDWSSPDDFRRTMDVNFHGMVGMVLALMPLLRRAKAARIVNVSSAAGYLASPFMGAYVASKHAIEGFSDVLRIELRELRIPVCVIEPTFHRTNLISNMDKVIESTFRSGKWVGTRGKGCGVLARGEGRAGRGRGTRSSGEGWYGGLDQ